MDRRMPGSTRPFRRDRRASPSKIASRAPLDTYLAAPGTTLGRRLRTSVRTPAPANRYHRWRPVPDWSRRPGWAPVRNPPALRPEPAKAAHWRLHSLRTDYRGWAPD